MRKLSTMDRNASVSGRFGRAAAMITVALVSTLLPIFVLTVDAGASTAVTAVSLNVDFPVAGNTTAMWEFEFTPATPITNDSISVSFPIGIDVSTAALASNNLGCVSPAVISAVSGNASVGSTLTIGMNNSCQVLAGNSAQLIFTGISASAAMYSANSFFVDTSQDSTPVSPSSGITVTASGPTGPSVSSVSISSTSLVENTTGTSWTAQFTASATGMLSPSNSVTVTFPAAFASDIPSTPAVTFGQSFSGPGCAAGAAGTTNVLMNLSVAVSISAPASCGLAALATGSVTIAGITNPAAATFLPTDFAVHTSADTADVNPSTGITITSATPPATSVTGVGFSLTPLNANATNATLTVTFQATTALSPGDTVTVTLDPAFTGVPSGPSAGFGFNFSGCGAGATGSTSFLSGSPVVSIVLPMGCTLAAGGTGIVSFAGITNPAAFAYGASGFSVYTTKDSNPVNPSSGITIAAALTSVSAVNFSGSSMNASAANTSWTVQFHDSSSGALSAGGTVTVAFDPAFTIPSSPAVTFGQSFTSCSAGATGSFFSGAITITLPATCALANSATGSVTIAGITNPAALTYGATGFVVYTSQDLNHINPSSAVTIASPSPPAPPAPALTITSPSFANYDANESGYSATGISASGGRPPFNFSIGSGSLPTGLTLNLVTGAVTGTPTAAGTAIFSIAATDSLGVTEKSGVLSIVISPALSIASASLPVGISGTSYSTNLVSSTGGSGSNTFFVSTGSLPTGLTMNLSTGAITGTPTAVGTSTFNVKVVDSNGGTATQAFTVIVNAAVPAGTAPGAPTAVIATSPIKVVKTINVSWTAPTTGSAVVNYRVIPFDVTTGIAGSAIGIVGTSAAISGLTPGDAYTFTVISVNTFGASIASIASNAAVPTATVETGVISKTTTDPALSANLAPVTLPALPGSTAVSVTTSTVGAGTVTVGGYTSDPVKGFSTGTGGTASSYFDVSVKQGSAFTMITFNVCHLSAGEKVYWYDSKAGKSSAVSNQTAQVNGCVKVTISTTTSPTIADLYGTVFGIVKVSASSSGFIVTTLNGQVTVGGSLAKFGSPSSSTVLAAGGAASIATTSTGKGYWLVTTKGNVFSFGDAKNYGSPGSVPSSVSEIVRTADDKGYWIVTHAGGVYHFGDASFQGSLVVRATKPTAAVISMAVTPTGNGYWLTTSLGAVYAFGDAKFHGSFTSPKFLVVPYRIVGIASTKTGNGYWITTTTGLVYSFGDAKNFGQLKLTLPLRGVVGITTSSTGGGYSLLGGNGAVYGFGDAKSMTAPKVSGTIISGSIA